MEETPHTTTSAARLRDLPPPPPHAARRTSTPSTAELIEQEKMLRGEHGAYDPPTPAPREVLWRHGHWIKKRERIRNAIMRTTKSHKRLARFDSCGAHGVVEHSKSRDAYRTTCWHCHDRLCQPCMAQRRRDILQIVRNNTAKKTARFITLTLKHRDASLRDEMKRLKTAFGKLRRSKFWRTFSEGGIAVPESKIGDDGRWHHHLHIVATGRYMDQAKLSEAWKQATGDSCIVDIQAAPQLESTVWYITKYVTKPVDATILEDEEKLVEFVAALRGQRTWNIFGDWTADKEDHTDESVNDWRPVCTIVELMQARDAGEEWARGLAQQLQRQLANLPPAAGP